MNLIFSCIPNYRTWRFPFLLFGLLLSLLTTPVLAWDQELIDAANAFAMGKPNYTNQQRVLVLSRNYDINLMGVSGHLDNGVFQICQRDFVEVSSDIGKKAAKAAGVYFEVQPNPPPYKPAQPGTDSDYLTGATKPDEVKIMKTKYNADFTQYLKDELGKELGGSIPDDIDWTAKNDIDFMGDAAADGATDENFEAIAKLNNAAYKRRGAALYEAYSRADKVGRPVLQQSIDYIDEMHDMIRHRKQLLEPLEANLKKYIEDGKVEKAERENADMFRHRALQAKYMVRIGVATDNLKKWLPDDSPLLLKGGSKLQGSSKLTGLTADFAELIVKASKRDMENDPTSTCEMEVMIDEILDRQLQQHLEVMAGVIAHHPEKVIQVHDAIERYASMLSSQQQDEVLDAIRKGYGKDVADNMAAMFKGIMSDKGALSADTIGALLAYFNLPNDYVIESGSGGHAALTRSQWPGVNFNIRGHKNATAIWRNYDSMVRNKRGWGPVKKASQAATIRLAIVEYASARDAKYAYKGAVSRQMLQTAAQVSQQEASEKLRQVRGTKTTSTTHKLSRDIDYNGGSTKKERLGKEREVVTIDFVEKNATLASMDKLVPIIQTNETTTAERLTSGKEIQRLITNRDEMIVRRAKHPPRDDLEKAFRKFPVPPIKVQFKTTTKTSSHLKNPGVPKYRQKQGILRFGRCVVFIEIINSYEHAVIFDNESNTHIHSDLSEVTHWTQIEQSFRRLAGRKLSFSINIALRLEEAEKFIEKRKSKFADELQEAYDEAMELPKKVKTIDWKHKKFQGIAADGISELNLIADITGAEDVVEQIGCIQWQVAEMPNPFSPGLISTKTKPINHDKNWRSYFGIYKAPEVVLKQHKQKISLVVISKDGERVTSKPIEIGVFPPPLIMVHGIWSSSMSMDSLLAELKNSGATSQGRFLKFDYADDSYKALLPNARALRKDIIGLIESVNGQGIKSARVNIVAHSLGGLLARMVILGRHRDTSLPGDGDKVLKLITLGTPHQGSSLASWYAEWKPAKFTNTTDPSMQDFRDLQTYIMTFLDIKSWKEESHKVRSDIFEFGPAVLDMKPEGNIFLDNLNKFQRLDDPHTHIRYYLVAGTKPLIESKYAGVYATALYNFTRAMDMIAIRSKSEQDKNLALYLEALKTKLTNLQATVLNYMFSGIKSQRFKQMVTEMFDIISEPDTDGAVTISSAIQRQLFQGRVGGTLMVPANHFDLVSDPTARSKVYEWLMKGEANQDQP